MKRKKLKGILIFCIIAVIALVIFAAAHLVRRDPDTQHIERVVNHLFSDISESDYKKLSETDWSGDTEQVPDWIRENFEKDMTDQGFSDLLETAAYNLSVLAYVNEKEMTLENLEIRLKDKNFEMEGQLTISDKQEGAKETEMIITGSGQTDEEGLVSYINIVNMDDIAEAVKE